jgi:hypothetical protein
VRDFLSTSLAFLFAKLHKTPLLMISLVFWGLCDYLFLQNRPDFQRTEFMLTLSESKTCSVTRRPASAEPYPIPIPRPFVSAAKHTHCHDIPSPDSSSPLLNSDSCRVQRGIRRKPCRVSPHSPAIAHQHPERLPPSWPLLSYRRDGDSRFLTPKF